MDRIAGVLNSVVVNVNGKICKIENDGYLGKLSADKALVEMRVAPQDASKFAVYGFTVDGKKNVQLKKDYSIMVGTERCYKMLVRIEQYGELRFTEYPANNFRIMRLSRKGNATIWEIALISQNGEFFLTTQNTYSVICYQKDGEMVCPQFEKWPQIVDFLREYTAAKWLSKEFRPISDKPAIKTAPNLPPSHVLWFNYASGVGAITTPEGTARVHWSQIARRPRLAYLIQGEKVSYEKLQAPNVTKRRETAFQKEALGVKPLA